MKIKKRRKSSRFRGSHSHGRGFKKKARGSGHRGGVGMAGTGKRADQRKTLVLNMYGNKYFGKSQRVARKVALKHPVIDLEQIEKQMHSFIKKGTAKKSSSGIELNLSDYKILSSGSLSDKVKITAFSASKKAIEKVKESGGEIILKNKE